MLYDIIPIVIIFLCLTGIIVIYFRKISYVATIDIQQLPKEQQAEVKKTLIEKRVEEKIKNLNLKVKNGFLPIFKFLKKHYQSARSRIKKIEEEYKQKHLFLIKKQPQMAQQKIQNLLEDGEKLAKEENLIEAEKKFIEVISIDPNNIEAYRNLGRLYLKQKNFINAKETFEHTLKLLIKSYHWWDGLRKKENNFFSPKINSQISSIYLDLGGAYKKIQDNEKALESYKKAAEIEPNNPKNLDFLIEMGIMFKKKKIVEKALADLKKVNPENEKIKEFEARLEKM
ncbi:MAG: Uncharacterized protein Athens101410_266 [Parcubacteria group bacterium Athens1014_10]|nr:MAG: Uncharacterized protein Athens101410_266 [Parcubacteria group bacterium Athens1014_10]TSD04995.1 MAG: Uncharacterized protein Athens071412_537 [Parcubacteria group bacterium Athens0714_12]